MTDNIIEFKRRTEANQQRIIELKNRILQAQMELALVQKKLRFTALLSVLWMGKSLISLANRVKLFRRAVRLWT